VCSDDSQTRQYNVLSRSCMAQAMANAVTSVNQPGLTAEHLAQKR
jgi:hypothetical protein